jgi:hypothetical protein
MSIIIELLVKKLMIYNNMKKRVQFFTIWCNSTFHCINCHNNLELINVFFRKFCHYFELAIGGVNLMLGLEGPKWTHFCAHVSKLGLIVTKKLCKSFFLSPLLQHEFCKVYKKNHHRYCPICIKCRSLIGKS